MSEKIRKLSDSVLDQFISVHYVPELSPERAEELEALLKRVASSMPRSALDLSEDDGEAPWDAAPEPVTKGRIRYSVASPADEDAFFGRDEPEPYRLDRSFAEMLQFWINEKDLKPSEFYNAANLHRSAFNNIINHPNVVPKKTTALACVIALRLNYDDAADLLKRAGYAFSDSQLTDVIVRCYMENGIYDIDEINEVLFEKDLSMLGSSMN